MRVAGVKKNHLNERLIKDLNKSLKNFSNEGYSRIVSIDNALMRRDISVEKKKRILSSRLHESVVAAFSIDKSKFNKSSFDSLKARLHSIRKITSRLRSINYYLETAFLQELRLAKINLGKELKIRHESIVAKDELEILEYSAYKLIEKAVMLDKAALKDYKVMETRAAKSEKGEAGNLGLVLRKESELLEHLEAKLPPPKEVSADLVREPIFTHWASRALAILSYFEALHSKEIKLISKFKKNNAARRRINKKIMHLIKEKSKLLSIMQEKSVSMRKIRIGSQFKKELHNFTTIINL